MRLYAALLLALLSAASSTAASAETVDVDPRNVEVARWQGWGCSLSWWGVYSASWSSASRTEVCRRLFSRDSDALALNICRYNAGGTAPDADASKYRLGAAVRVMLDRDGSWHPDRDAAQLGCLRLAKRFGADTFEVFVNSPPWWMLKNRNTRGADDGGENLDRSRQVDYAEWLAATAARVQKEAGIRLSSVAPFNEPSAGWWNGTKSSQEGCRLTWGAQAAILRALRAALERKLSSVIACSDENGAHGAYNTLEWMTAPDRGNWSGGGLDNRTIGRVNVHSYAGWEWQARLHDLAVKCGVPVWMSEVSHREWENAGFVPDDMRCALPLSRSIVSDIKRLRCAAWVYWQPVEPMQYGLWYHYTYGLLPAAVDADVNWHGRTYHPGEFVTARSFFAMRQFSAFIRPGDSFVSSGDEWTVAALSPDGKRLVLVVHSDSREAKDYTFQLDKVARVGPTVAVYRTCDDAAGKRLDCARLPDIRIVGKAYADRVPPRSVTTYVVGASAPR